MSDPIAPVMEAWEWAQMFENVRDAEAMGFGRDSAAHPLTHGAPPIRHATQIALANAALPDDDPRKITRDWVRAMRDLANAIESAQGSKMVGAIRLTGPAGTTHVSTGNDWRGMADALESYLPPEAP